MSVLKIFSISLLVILATYTVFVVSNQGFDFLTGFIGDIFSVTWRGQINIDFSAYLMLSALWVAWRHQFSVFGLGIAVVVMIGGMLLFAPYLIYEIARSKGEMSVLLMGAQNQITN